MKIVQLFAAACLSLCGSLALVDPAHAVADSCSVTGTTSASIGSYNPFSGSSLTQVPVNLVLTRYVNGGHETDKVDFYLIQPTGSPAGITISYQNSNILYTLPATHPLSATSPPSGTAFYAFGGAGNPDTATIPMVVTIPAGLDLTSAPTMTFSIVYECTGIGGLHDVKTPTTLAGAITLQVNIQSALQASYAGAALDFGEVGAVTNAQAPSHTAGGAIRVASSGPFTVMMTSANGYKMTYPGGSLSTAAQTIKYSAHFAGQTKDSVAPTFSTVTCARATLTGENLPLSVALEEGGQGKTPSPSYRDTITITVTPLATPYGGGTSNCPSL